VLLKPILARFVSSFDIPEADETKDFYQKTTHYSSGNSGPTYLSVRILTVLRKYDDFNMRRTGLPPFVSGVVEARCFMNLDPTQAVAPIPGPTHLSYR
jgi:hypothetical protein